MKVPAKTEAGEKLGDEENSTTLPKPPQDKILDSLIVSSNSTYNTSDAPATWVNWLLCASFGIEALTLDLETALTHIDELLDKYPSGKARLLHIQVDRRSRRHGQVVNDYTFLLKDWSAERRKYITEEISSNNAAGKIFGSLQEDTKQYREGKRRSRREMP